MDGFDHYTSADISAKWEANDMGATISTVLFRTTGQSLQISGAALYQIPKRLSAAAQNIVMGFGLRMNSSPSGTTMDNAGAFMVLHNDVGYSANSQFGMAIGNDGHIRVGRCSATGLNSTTNTQLGIGTAVLTSATWYYVEVRVYIHATAGAIEVRVNGVVDILLTGQNTKANATYAGAEYLHVRSMATPSWNLDDLYLRSETSTSEVTGGFLGDIKIKPYYPNGDGTYTAMTCSTGTTHYTLVDEATPNTTDYVSSSTALTKDSYGFQDASETGSIKAVQVSAYCYKVDAGFRGVDVFTKSGATEVFGTSQPLSTTPKYVIKMFEQDPNTSADWSQTNLNAAEFGVRISADL